MISSWIIIPLQAAGSAWTVQVGPWSLPPLAWMPVTAVVGAIALRTRRRHLRTSSEAGSFESDAE